jgi:hypothetical protein
MGKNLLPTKRLYSKCFADRGFDDVVKIDVWPVADGERLVLAFEAVTSRSRQGVFLSSDGYLTINGQDFSSVSLWQDTSPKEVAIECHTKQSILHVYNVWDCGRGQDSQAWTSGMRVEELTNGRRYRCNDIGSDPDFSAIVFRLERSRQGS